MLKDDDNQGVGVSVLKKENSSLPHTLERAYPIGEASAQPGIAPGTENLVRNAVPSCALNDIGPATDVPFKTPDAAPNFYKIPLPKDLESPSR